MKVLVVGSGGREHALVWKIKQSKKVDSVYCAPGNGGISLNAKCIKVAANNIKGLADFAHRNKINLTVVGPEQPLAAGIADEFQKRRLKVFGPGKKASQMESSKVFAKQFMQRNHIPTAPFKVFDSAAEAIGFCKSVEFPVVVKADGLAAGKGVKIARDIDEATDAINSMMVKKVFGKAGKEIVVESFLDGQEASIMAITDGKTIIPMLPSQDHKQAYEDDKGPNTGGMGAYCPTRFVTSELKEHIQQLILSPMVAGLRNEDIVYKGVIYAGLMLTEQGPKVLEINCRFGDPETQAVLPLLSSDLVEVMMAAVDNRLGSVGRLKWRKGVASCVVMASRGYPGKYITGKQISGLRKNWQDGNMVFHAGTKRSGGTFMTSGGRVIGVVGIDTNLKQSLDRAYGLVKKIKFEGARYRRDIGFRALGRKGE
jgi:phosphoribosylamine--glycine ligase